VSWLLSNFISKESLIKCSLRRKGYNRFILPGHGPDNLEARIMATQSDTKMIHKTFEDPTKPVMTFRPAMPRASDNAVG
jgi:hypothetical protein